MHRYSSTFLTWPALVCALLSISCREHGQVTSKGGKAALTNTTSQTVSHDNVRTFHTSGIIRDFPPGGRTVLVRHENIPGYMPAMTMELDMRDTNELGGLRIGDRIEFNVVATEETSWIEELRRLPTNEVPNVAVPTEPTSVSILHANRIQPGELLPDFELLAEDGRTIKLSDFEGEALAFTYIFTRCPLPNFCPRMNQNFSRAREILSQEAGTTNWSFLSISFDPDFDKPEILSRYAWSYRGGDSNRWVFASAATPVIEAMSPLVDFRFTNEGGSIQHNLRTVVLDPRRRVFKLFEGNSWHASELAEAMKVAAAKRASQTLNNPL